jgi:hypothetical protein
MTSEEKLASASQECPSKEMTVAAKQVARHRPRREQPSAGF